MTPSEGNADGQSFTLHAIAFPKVVASQVIPDISQMERSTA